MDVFYIWEVNLGSDGFDKLDMSAAAVAASSSPVRELTGSTSKSNDSPSETPANGIDGRMSLWTSWLGSLPVVSLSWTYSLVHRHRRDDVSVRRGSSMNRVQRKSFVADSQVWPSGRSLRFASTMMSEEQMHALIHSPRLDQTHRGWPHVHYHHH